MFLGRTDVDMLQEHEPQFSQLVDRVLGGSSEYARCESREIPFIVDDDEHTPDGDELTVLPDDHSAFFTFIWKRSGSERSNCSNALSIARHFNVSGMTL